MTDLHSYEIDDPTFVDDLKASDKHVDRVILWLKEKGNKVRKKKLQIRPDVEQMSEYADDGDIEIIYPNGRIGRLEIKQRMLNFTSKSDFPYNTIIVDVTHTWDNAEIKPDGYILTNKECTSAILVDSSTRDKWISSRRWDAKKGRYRNFYECPIEYTRSVSMVKNPNGICSM